MVSLKDIKGQSNAVRFLEGSLASSRIANSYLFTGCEGVGRALAAKAFIARLMCREGSGRDACLICPSCRRVETLEHPDLLWIKPDKNKAIKIDEIRKAKDVLNLKAYEAPVNVSVIEDSHMMTQEAANALLKVLEEPPGESLLILITHKKELLAETVISRCAEVRFQPLSPGETKDIILEKADISEESAWFLACFSQGSPGKALQMLEEGLDKRKESIVSLAGEIAREENASCMNWSSENKDALLEDVDMLIMFFRDIALAREGLKRMVLDNSLMESEMYRFFKNYSSERIFGIVERLIDTRRALLGNVNPKLVAQALAGAIKST